MPRLVPEMTEAVVLPPLPTSGALAWLLGQLAETAAQNQKAALTPEHARLLTRTIQELAQLARHPK